MKTGLFQQIEDVLAGKDGWCTLEKATTLASIIIANRSRVIVEIGVWTGSSLIPMALAAKALGEWPDPISGKPGYATVYAVDPWDPKVSMVEQGDVHKKWWGEAPHAWAYETFAERLKTFEVADIVKVLKMPSSSWLNPPERIDVLHIDGNHGPQAITDVMFYGARVRQGGYLILDDLDWEGGHVRKAFETAVGELGYRPLYNLETGIVLQRFR